MNALELFAKKLMSADHYDSAGVAKRKDAVLQRSAAHLLLLLPHDRWWLQVCPSACAESAEVRQAGGLQAAAAVPQRH